jgi:myotubularin-related protein 3/4
VWFHRINAALKQPLNFTDVFPFIHHAYLIDSSLFIRETNRSLTESLTIDYNRLAFNLSGAWRITEANTKYSLCSSYPKLFIVPNDVSDDVLFEVAKYRSMGRIPAVVWRHKVNGCVLARSSQPMVGMLGWRCHEDETFILALSKACVKGRGSGGAESSISNGHIPSLPVLSIFDLRSYGSALANRAKGGGFEHTDYYHNSIISYKGLANIHSVKSSFNTLRSFLASTDHSRFLSLLEGSQWLYYISQLLQTSSEVVSTINDNSQPVLIHCSDGWDRTTQVISLSQLLLDPYYRTIDGFIILVEREWLSFGHKFADRNGFGLDGESSPIFLQWLDCIHQLLIQFPLAFQFNSHFLVKLCQHCYCQLFGTFLANCEQEREKDMIRSQTLSVWSLLTAKEYHNLLYKPEAYEGVLSPDPRVSQLVLWKELYMGRVIVPYWDDDITLTTPTTINNHDNSNHDDRNHSNNNGHLPQARLSPSNTSNSIISSSQLWHSTINTIELEDSFRVVTEGEASMTTRDVAMTTKEVAMTTVIPASRETSLSYSQYSQCETRLRNLGQDGLSWEWIDPLHERMREMEELYDRKLEALEDKVKRLTQALRHRQKESDSYRDSEDEVINGIDEGNDQCVSPGGAVNDWMYVNVSDGNGGVKWVPDHAASHCRLCGAEFWLGKRKHHCRSCGGVFCWQCSNYYTPVPHEQLFHDQRVCRSCFDRLGGYHKDDA